MRDKIILVTALVAMVCGLIVPRWYYRMQGATGLVDVVNAIYTAMAVEIGVLGALIAIKK